MSDEEELTLSTHALAALAEFRKEESAQAERFAQLEQQAQEDFDKLQEPISIDEFPEDWQLSQFWYSDATADVLARALLEGASSETVVCIASAPSVYAAVRRLAAQSGLPTRQIYLLEYDPRFAVLAGKDRFFVYDYQTPDNVPEQLVGKCDRLLIDPPFLEPECQTKSAIAAKKLLRGSDSFVVSCTGERMKDVVLANYEGMRITDFYPEHKNGLQNEFRCYANKKCGEWSLE
ncbi:protein-lysine N-methyltransferase Efm5p [Diutina catenulata]